MEALTYLDSHVVAWLYAGRLDLFTPRALRVIDTAALRISPAVVLELEYLHEVGRLGAKGSAVVQALSAQLGLRECDLPFPAVVESALDQSWTRDPFDRLIVGQAVLAGSPLITKDRMMRRHYRRAMW